MALVRVFITWTILVLGLCVVAEANRWRDQGEGDRNMKEIGTSNVKFSFSLYKVLARTPGNVFFSPLSIHSILTMLSLGAKAKTYDQIKQGLYLPSVEKSQLGYKGLNKAFRSSVDKGVTIKVANKVYSSTKFELDENFRNASEVYFNSGAESVDFGNSQKVRNKINQWVEENTNRKIMNLVPSGVLSADTAMVLVNAVFFKGKWQTQFDPKNTTLDDFITSTGREKVQFMQTTSEFGYRYSRGLKAGIVELNYNGGKFSMVILLPSKGTDFQKMEELLPNTDPAEYMPGPYDKFNVKIALPKFKLEQITPLVDPLVELGMSDMFSDAADLRGLASGGPGLKVSKVLHKAFVEVNEEGSEAAATTAMIVQTLSLNSEDSRTVEFILNRPFVFMIRHKASNSILFMGRYTSALVNEGASAEPSQPPRRPKPTEGRPESVQNSETSSSTLTNNLETSTRRPNPVGERSGPAKALARPREGSLSYEPLSDRHFNVDN